MFKVNILYNILYTLGNIATPVVCYNNPMNINQWIKSATKQLELVSIASARIDCLILLEDELGRDRAWILANPDYELNTNNIKNLQKNINRRTNHEPIAYIRGKSEFFGREFAVSADTLQPRPETETLISILKTTCKEINKHPTIIDIGTGSGCLAISAKLEMPKSKAIAIDISNKALSIAKQNAKNLKADVEFRQGNLLEPITNIKHQVSNIVIMANLPYVPDSHTINQSAMHEPSIAIFGGADGLDLYREMFSQISSSQYPVSFVFTEALPPQHRELAQIASSHHFEIAKSEDFIQVFKRSY